MANSVTVNVSLSFINTAGGATQTRSLSSGALSFGVAGNHGAQNIMNVPTTAGGTAIPKGSVGTVGWLLIHNMDATNYVQIMTAVSGTVFGRVNAGEWQLFRLDQSVSAPAAIANSSAVDIECWLIEN